MKTSQYLFLIGAVIELVVGVALLAVYNNSLGYIGLIGSALLMAFIPLSNLADKPHSIDCSQCEAKDGDEDSFSNLGV